MKPDRKAQIATAVLMAGLGAFVAWKQGAFDRVAAVSVAPVESKPQDAIYETLDAVREGDLPKYIAAHTGSMQTALQRAAREIGDARLLQTLKERNAPLKGIAVLEPDRLSDREIKLQVEYVYADRNEIQVYYLEKAADRWKISRVEGTRRIETLIPWGTPVN